MTKSGAVVVGIALMLSSNIIRAEEHCIFDHPSRARRFDATLVRAFIPCGGICFGGDQEGTSCGADDDCAVGGVCRAVVGGRPVVPRTPNTQSGNLGNPACSEPFIFTVSAWKWGFLSKGSVLAKMVKNDGIETPLNPRDTARFDLQITLHLDGVVDYNTNEPADGAGSLQIVVRPTYTDRDPLVNYVTAQDIVTSYAFTLIGGQASLRTSTNVFLNGMGEYSIPSGSDSAGNDYCTSIEWVDAVVLDSNGTVFARLGNFL